MTLGAAYWWTRRAPALPAGIAYGNGRLEADPIDIATKFAGRVAELRVDEGDMVRAGQPPRITFLIASDLEAHHDEVDVMIRRTREDPLAD